MFGIPTKHCIAQRELFPWINVVLTCLNVQRQRNNFGLCRLHPSRATEYNGHYKIDNLERLGLKSSTYKQSSKASLVYRWFQPRAICHYNYGPKNPWAYLAYLPHVVFRNPCKCLLLQWPFSIIIISDHRTIPMRSSCKEEEAHTVVNRNIYCCGIVRVDNFVVLYSR